MRRPQGREAAGIQKESEPRKALASRRGTARVLHATPSTLGMSTGEWWIPDSAPRALTCGHRPRSPFISDTVPPHGCAHGALTVLAQVSKTFPDAELWALSHCPRPEGRAPTTGADPCWPHRGQTVRRRDPRRAHQGGCLSQWRNRRPKRPSEPRAGTGKTACTSAGDSHSGGDATGGQLWLRWQVTGHPLVLSELPLLTETADRTRTARLPADPSHRPRLLRFKHGCQRPALLCRV